MPDVTITGTRTNTVTGEPLRARGYIEPTTSVIRTSTGTPLGGLPFTLDETGSFSVTVPATDDPDLSPRPFTYRIGMRTSDAEVLPDLVFEAPGSLLTLDIASIAPVVVPGAPLTPSQYGLLEARLGILEAAPDIDPGAATSRQPLVADGAGGTSWGFPLGGVLDMMLPAADSMGLAVIPYSSSNSTGRADLNTVALTPVFTRVPFTIDRVGFHISALGQAGEIVHFGLYRWPDPFNAFPEFMQTLCSFDISTGLTGARSINIDQPLTVQPGIYAVGIRTVAPTSVIFHTLRTRGYPMFMGQQRVASEANNTLLYLRGYNAASFDDPAIDWRYDFMSNGVMTIVPQGTPA